MAILVDKNSRVMVQGIGAPQLAVGCFIKWRPSMAILVDKNSRVMVQGMGAPQLAVGTFAKWIEETAYGNLSR